MQSNIGGIIRLDRKTLEALATILALATLTYVVYLGAGIVADATGKADPSAESVRPVAKCKTVLPRVYNKRVKILDAVTGKRHHKASRKVCKNTFYRRLGQRIRKARKACKRRALVVTASTYGTHAGDDNGIGYRGDNLFDFNDSFAELGWGRALGGLALHAVRWVKAGRYVRRGVKRDIGPTHPGLGGTIRGIDLHAPLARSLRVSGLRIVRVSRHNCWA